MVINKVSIKDCELLFFIFYETVNFSRGALPHGAKYIKANDSRSG